MGANVARRALGRAGGRGGRLLRGSAGPSLRRGDRRAGTAAERTGDVPVGRSREDRAGVARGVAPADDQGGGTRRRSARDLVGVPVPRGGAGTGGGIVPDGDTAQPRRGGGGGAGDRGGGVGFAGSWWPAPSPPGSTSTGRRSGGRRSSGGSGSARDWAWCCSAGRRTARRRTASCRRLPHPDPEDPTLPPHPWSTSSGAPRSEKRRRWWRGAARWWASTPASATWHTPTAARRCCSSGPTHRTWIRRDRPPRSCTRGARAPLAGGS